MAKRLQFKTSSKKYLLLALLVIAASVTLISSDFKNIRFAENADEGYYFYYANYIGHAGFGGIKDLFKGYIENQQNWVFPNPLRIGFITISSLWLNVFGFSLFNLAYLSLLSFCIFLLTCFYFVKKYFGERTALLTIMLLAFSPLNMAMSRRALLDSCVNLFMVLSVWLFFDSLKENKRIKTILFILAYSFTILVKETSVLLSIFFIFYIFLRRVIFNKSIKLIDFLAITLFPFAIVGIVYVVSSGNISGIIDTINIIINSPQTNQYAIMFGSGPWFSYIIDWILLSPLVAILAISFILHYLTKDEWKDEIIYLVLFSVTLTFLLSLFTKNIRYLIFLDMPIRLFAVLMLNEFCKRIFKAKYVNILCITIVMVISVFDYLNYNNMFIKQGIYDPVSYALLQVTHIVPFK